eukprot:7035641-Ditylum_brightwellii.AAC.1
MLSDCPKLKYLMLYNIDTVGADVDPGLFGLFLDGEGDLNFEVVPWCIDDQGGSLARVNGTTYLVEDLSLPQEENEFKFCYYNSMTTWIDIGKIFTNFGLKRSNLSDEVKCTGLVIFFPPM